jgi:hypothetical protein
VRFFVACAITRMSLPIWVKWPQTLRMADLDTAQNHEISSP